MAAQNKSNEIRLTRVFDAPVKAVWDAWADSAQIAKWWGPRGFTLTTHDKDLRAGGHWKYTMHGPDGVDYPNTTKFLEVEKYSRMVYDHGGDETSPPLFRVTLLFSETNGKTKMDMTMTLPSAEAAANTAKFIKKAGGDSAWDRLAEFLRKELTGKDEFIINRTFDAPLEKMFDMWSKPEHLSKWLPPTGFTMQFIRCDMKPGGSGFYSMTGANNMKMFGRCDYLKFDKPDRIVYTQQFCDQNEKVSRHPMSPTWPETMLTTVQFAAEGPDRTRVTVTWEPTGKVSAEELQTFVKARGGMTQGWTGSFDKLEAYLANRSETEREN